MGTNRKIDWARARTMFISTELTLREVAEKVGCALQTIREHAARGQWTLHREQFGRDLEKTAAAQALVNRATELRDTNEADVKIAKAMRARVARRLNKLAQIDPDCDKSQDELRTLSNIHAELQRTVRLALGATTENAGLVPNPDEDGRPAPSLSDFYQTVIFEGPTKPAEHAQGGSLAALPAPTTT